jgi:uncharacterized protein YaiI (UPF0178 family)
LYDGRVVLIVHMYRITVTSELFKRLVHLRSQVAELRGETFAKRLIGQNRSTKDVNKTNRRILAL